MNVARVKRLTGKGGGTPYKTKEPGNGPRTPLPATPHKGGRAPVPATGGIKKPKKHKPGVVALHKIHRFQKLVGLLIPLLSFSHVVRELAWDFKVNLCFQSSALMAIQEAAETFLVNLFEAAYFCCIHCKHETIAPKHLHLVKAIHHISDLDLWWVLSDFIFVTFHILFPYIFQAGLRTH